MPSTLSLFLKRELQQIWRSLSDTINPLIFFVIVMVLFPLAITPEKNIMQVILPAAIWVAVLLATLMSLDNLFREDYQDGSIEQYIVSGRSLTTMVLAKIIAHWLSTGALLSLIACITCLAAGFDSQFTLNMLLSLLLGTIGLQAIGAIGSALTVSLSKNVMLLAIIVLPLYIPILIFGAGSARFASQGTTDLAANYFLCSLSVLAITLAPIATSTALKNSLD